MDKLLNFVHNSRCHKWTVYPGCWVACQVVRENGWEEAGCTGTLFFGLACNSMSICQRVTFGGFIQIAESHPTSHPTVYRWSKWVKTDILLQKFLRKLRILRFMRWKFDWKLKRKKQICFFLSKNWRDYSFYFPLTW